MVKKMQYTTEEQRQDILETNNDLRLIEEHNLVEGNFLIFTDERPELPKIIYTNVPQEEFELIKNALDELILGGI